MTGPDTRNMDTSRNPSVRIRTGITDSLSNKPCRSCGTLMDDAGTHFVCLSCGHRLDKTVDGRREANAWEKQVANLQSQQQISAGQAKGIQFTAGLGPLRMLAFLGLAAAAALGPLQNLFPLIDGRSAGPLAVPTVSVLLLILVIAGWAGFGQPGPQRMLQRNILAVLSLACLAGLAMAAPLNRLLAEQFGAMHNGLSEAGGTVAIAATPAIWHAGPLLGSMFITLAALAVICHFEAAERPY